MIGRVRARLGRLLRPTAAPSRAELIDRKHRLESEIRQLNRRISATAARGDQTAAMQARLGRLRDEHLRTRLRIDRTP